MLISEEGDSKATPPLKDWLGEGKVLRREGWYLSVDRSWVFCTESSTQCGVTIWTSGCFVARLYLFCRE